MLYKQELQSKNEQKLLQILEKDGTPKYIERYLLNIKSKAGAINYWIAIRDLLNYLLEKKVIERTSIAEITPQDLCLVDHIDVDNYLESKEIGGMSPTTLNTRQNIFSSFFGYLAKSDKYPVKANCMKESKYDGISSNNGNIYKKLPTDEQIQQMLGKIAHKQDELVRERNLAIVLMFLGSGMRVSEVVGLNLEDLVFQDASPHVNILGKGEYKARQVRKVFLTGSATEALQKWLEVRSTIDGIENVNAVFVTKNLKRMTEEGVKKMFKNYSDITPHELRHYYGTIMPEETSIQFVMQNLGHKRAETTLNNYTNGHYGMSDVLAKL